MQLIKLVLIASTLAGISSAHALGIAPAQLADEAGGELNPQPLPPIAPEEMLEAFT